MATRPDRPRGPGRTHTDEEWERVKLLFHHYYIEKNMSLKEAAKNMSDKHGFDATLRQWERRIAPEKWGFSKYASREERLRQIENAGKTLLEVSNRGRRKSTASDGRPSLKDDRNMRRFARREVSRGSRDRARSVSVLSDQSDQELEGTSVDASPAPSDYIGSQGDTHSSQPNFGDIWGSVRSTQELNIPQIRIIESDASNLDVPSVTFLHPEEATYIAPDHIPTSAQSQVNNHYPATFSDEFQGFSNSANQNFDNAFATDGQIDMTMNWNDPFGVDAKSEAFPEFSFVIGPQPSFPDLAGLGTSHSLKNQDPQLQEQIETLSTPLKDIPDFDNTHQDVHALLQDHFNSMTEMLKGCINGLQGVPGGDSIPRSVVMSHLKLLESGISNQNKETDRNIRNTLKNIASIQRRANRNIYDLSTKRKKKIAELEIELNNLRNSSFTYE